MKVSICFCLLPVLGWSESVSSGDKGVLSDNGWPKPESECLDSVQVVTSTAGDIWGATNQPWPSNDNKSENKIHSQLIFSSLVSPLEVVGWVKLLFILTTAGREL